MTAPIQDPDGAKTKHNQKLCGADFWMFSENLDMAENCVTHHGKIEAASPLLFSRFV
jgi:hypothetical protein